MLAMTLSGPGGRGGGGRGGGGRGGGGGGHHHGGHHGGHRRGGWGPGRGWAPYYNYGPEVVVVPPLRDCQFTITMPGGEQIIVTGACPIQLTGPVTARITPL